MLFTKNVRRNINFMTVSYVVLHEMKNKIIINLHLLTVDFDLPCVVFKCMWPNTPGRAVGWEHAKGNLTIRVPPYRSHDVPDLALS